MINKYTNKQRGLLAVIMAMVMVFAGAAFVAAEVDGGDSQEVVVKDMSAYGVSNTNLGNILYSEGYKVTGYVNNLKNTDETTRNSYLGTWENAKDYNYALVVGIPEPDTTIYYVSNGELKSADGDVDGIAMLKYVSEGTFTIDYTTNTVSSIKEYNELASEDIKTISFDLELIDVPIVDSLSIKDDKIDLTNDVVVKNTTTLTSGTTINLNGYTIYSVGNAFFTNSENVKIDIIANGGSIKTNGSVVRTESAGGALTINGGYYTSPDFTFLIYSGTGSVNQGTAVSNVSINNATIDAFDGSAVWFSRAGADTVEITGTEINAKQIGVYFGTVNNAVIEDCTIVSDETTAVEVKSGNVKFENGSIKGNVYSKSTGNVNDSGSGSGEAPLNINNGYQHTQVKATTPADKDIPAELPDVVVTINGTSIINDGGSYAIQIVAGIDRTANISFTTDSQTIDEICVLDYSTYEINVDVLGSDEIEVTNEAPTEVRKDTVLVVNNTIDDLNATVLEGSELRITTTGVNTVSGIVELGTGDDVSTVILNEFKGTFSVSKGSVKILGDIDSGIVTLTGEAIMVGDVTVASGAELVIDQDSTLSIPAGTVLTNNGIVTNDGEITINGKLVGPLTNTNGVVIAAPGVDTSKITGGEVKLSGESFGMSQDLESDYTVKTNAFLEKDLTIPKGVTLTIEGNLNLNGYTLFIEGSLVVEKKGVIETSVRGGSIQLAETGTVSNEGIIGNTTEVTVSAENGQVVMKGVTGIEFSLTKVKDNGYFLTVSGEVAVKVKESNTLTIAGAYIADGFIVKDVEADIAGTILKDATVTIGSKAVVTANIAEMQNGSTLIVNGVINGTVNMVNGAEVVVNGESDATYTAKTGDFTTYNSTTNKKQTAEQATTTVTTTIATADLKGITISVTTKSYTAQNADKTPMTEQKLLVSGIAAVADGKDKDAEATLTVTGKAYIAEGSEFVIPSKVKFTTTDLVTDGLLKIVDANDLNSIVYEGSMYTITVTDEATYDETVTDYYTTFDAAYAAIADADEMTITISGGYKFAKDYIIAAGQTIEAATGEFTITKDGTITIQDEGALELPKLDVKGILTVIYGADCDVTDLTYEVMSKNTETGDITYSGAELAIENAVAGDVIDIVDDVVFEDPVTIAEGVTVNVDAGATITAEKGLTVAGKLVNEGTVEIADEYDLIVTGEMENENDVIIGIDLETGDVVQDTESEMTVTGTVVSDDAISGTINAASYTDEDNNIVYTTVASAVATGENVAVSGKFTENADVVLAEEQTLTINGEVVLKSIRLVAGSNLTVNGKLTADVIAAVGTEETTGAISDAVVDVVKITGITNWTVNYNEAKATYTMVMPTYTSGDVVIEAGSVNYDAAATFGNTVQSGDPVYKTMKVASGATLVISKDITDATGDKKYFVNEGTIIVSDDMKFTNVLLGGTVNVDLGKTLTLATSQIAGEVILATKEGKDPASVAISGQVLIGSTPETLGTAGSIIGKIDATLGFVIVFEGSTFQDTTEDSKIESTAYSVNGIAFATIYTAQSKIIANDDIKALVNALEDVKNIGTDDSWYADKIEIVDQKIGEYESVNIKLGYEFVKVTISAAPGIIVYIDDVIPTLDNGVGYFEIGTHTITIYLEKGYEGTPVVKLNETEITDGKLVITTDMMGDDKQNLLSVTGATVMQDQPVVIQPSDSEKDGMELTDILLIVLVVLIVIMAIIVALRMMRS